MGLIRLFTPGGVRFEGLEGLEGLDFDIGRAFSALWGRGPKSATALLYAVTGQVTDWDKAS